jgi:inosose dehydratase
MDTMTIGIGYGMAAWWRDGHPENIYRGLDEIALAGFDGVEIFGAPYQTFTNRPAHFRRLLEMHGLTLSSVYSGYTYLDPARQAHEDEEFRRVAAFAAEAGAKWVLLDGGHKPNLRSADDVTDDDVAIVADAATRYAGVAREHGLSLAWHQHWGGVFEWSAPFHRFMARTDPSLVHFCPDTAQLSMGDYDVRQTFERYATRMGYVHFKDLAPNHDWATTARHGGPKAPRDSGGYHVDSKWRMVELGRGQIDFPALLAILQRAGFDGWIVDDMDYSAYSTLESATACRDYLREALGLTGRKHAGGQG